MSEGVLDFFQTQKIDTGRQGSEEKWSERQSRNLLLRRQSHEIAEKLKSVGVDLFAPEDPDADTVTLVGDLSGETENSLGNEFKHSLFLPAVAAQDRARQTNSLEIYLQNHKRGRFARYLVVTSGTRISWFDPALASKISTFQKK